MIAVSSSRERIGSMAVYHLLFEFHCQRILISDTPELNNTGSIGVFYVSESNGEIYQRNRVNFFHSPEIRQ